MTMTRLILIAAILGVAAPAAAQPEPAQPAPEAPDDAPPEEAPPDDPAPAPPDSGDRPWAAGVSAEDQRTALGLFSEGNGFLRDSLFLNAVGKYREAISHWDHPAIHYNLALALLNLDQPIEVYQSLQRAIAYGAAPLDEDKLKHASSYMRLVEQQLAHVEISCQAAGARVMLDGRELFVGPGNWEGIVRVGDHTLMAQKAGYITTTETRTFKPNEKVSIELDVYTAQDLTRYRRRWDTWKPWTVVGAGAAVFVVGGLLHASARSGFQRYDDGIAACGGCVPPPGLVDEKSGAETKQTLAMVSYAAGAAGLVTGLVLVYVNRPQGYRIDEQQRGLAVAPLVTPEVTGVTAAFRF
jgi:hypothetical protein